MSGLEKLWKEIEDKRKLRKQFRINKGCTVIERPASCVQKGSCACYALDGWSCKDRLGEEYDDNPRSEAKKELVQPRLSFGGLL